MTIRPAFACSAALIVAILGSVRGDEPPAAGDPKAQKELLAGFNELVGRWRGIGQPKRGSNQGAWKEEAEWIWDFADHGVAVRYDVTDGSLAKTARITADPETKLITADLTLPDGTHRTLTGKEDEKGKLVLTSSEEGADEVHRLSITRLNEKRTLVLFEKRPASQSTFNRVAEIGYTREGTRLATSGSNGPECIVTGGAGTIEIQYKGKTYYVCCTGCQQAFEDDPEGVIAEAAERRKREQEEAAKK